ncbi:aminoglycoside phosphotransferase family protein [Mycolicibacterium septicum DSM 44393]|uniref:Aminoglycoside phosphotransferase family protein n=1 Tax=Mycolicibacterium septicum DSM 44393 TaxID=1341646 RepID=A0A7X6RW98_9MYCO|nr:aminoglycoside phosphotransferase family protein [Mycolicibacterium septicum]NKZ11380.1 aminoglycoside phosphotransferase family protein [Mycolicibacterium septicum DSM 44393]
MTISNRLAIPSGSADVTAEWLSSALQDSHPTTSVIAVALEPVGTGQAGATYRATVRYAANPAGLPATLIVKLSSQRPEIRAKVSSSYRVEHAFYSQLASRVEIPLPRAYHCEISEDNLDFVLVMADQAPAEQGDQIDGCSAERGRLAARAIAGLHGPLWCDTTIADYAHTVMPRPGPESAAALGQVMANASEIGLREVGHLMAAEDQATFTEAAALTESWLLLEPERFSILHGDYRIDNLLFAPDDSAISVVDWQSVTVGLPGRDLGYFAATSLLPELRAEIERELVSVYHAALQSHGVAEYDEQDCWDDYRLGILQGTLISGLAAAFTPSPNERAERMLMAMMSRSCRAIRELGVLELIREMSDETAQLKGRK